MRNGWLLGVAVLTAVLLPVEIGVYALATQPCPECDGKGYFWKDNYEDKVTCPYCGGFGIVNHGLATLTLVFAIPTVMLLIATPILFIRSNRGSLEKDHG